MSVGIVREQAKMSKQRNGQTKIKLAKQNEKNED